ncbi:MAG: hypothetical protein GY851_06170 [bacterium]|nr:hypothetical protein [bacterium]
MSDSKPDDVRRETGEDERADEQGAREETCGRRRFLRRVGLSGATAGLAHFMLLGGRREGAHAQYDPCGTLHDTCTPSNGDLDECQPGVADPYQQEVGDECPGATGDTDDCNGYPYTTILGDECIPQHSVADVCDFGDGIMTSDAAKSV